jgi:DNA-binding FadR family transcriptional regulator
MLRKMVAGMRRNRRNPALWVQNDFGFHQTISRATGNPLFELIGSGLRECLQTSMGTTFRSCVMGAQGKGIADIHEAIADAIDDHQVRRAEYLMTAHFQEVKNALQTTFHLHSAAGAKAGTARKLIRKLPKMRQRSSGQVA